MSRVTYIDQEHTTRLIEEPEAAEQAVLQFFLDYWNASRAGAELPVPASFVPREVRGHLQWVTLVDVLSPQEGEFRYRLVGSRVADYFLGNGTGKTLRDAFEGADPGFIEGALWLLRRTCELRRPVQLTGPSSRWSNVYFPSFDNLYLPYSTDGERVDRIINIFTFDKTILPGRAAMSFAS